MSFIQMYAKELISLIVPFLTWAINRTLKSKAKLILGNPHNFTFLVQQPLLREDGTQVAPRQTAHTSSFVLKNAGTEPAKQVELVFNWKPLCLNIWPSRHITEHVEQDDRYVVILDNLAPGELVGFELLSVNADLPQLILARSEQCVAKSVELAPQPVAKPWQVKVFVSLALFGLGFSIYLLLLLLQFVILRSPLP